MNQVLLEWIGYIASLIVLISLLMSSLKKLRWINLVGAAFFAFYGFMIGSIPTGLMNVGIVVIDVVYLAKMYLTSDYFKILPVSEDSSYIKAFVKFYEKDINVFSHPGGLDIENSDIRLYVLRNMTPAGLFLADKFDDETLEIRLDYAVPQYRDFKLGKFLFEQNKDYFSDLGYKQFVAFTDQPMHVKYLLKMGFHEINLGHRIGYMKSI